MDVGGYVPTNEALMNLGPSLRLDAPGPVE
jgi:hypothetical protein